MKEVIDLAADDKFSEFSKNIKQSLEDKLRNNPTIKANGDKLNKFTDMADKFKEIATKETVPTEPVEPTEPSEPVVPTEPVTDPAVATEPTEPNSED